MRRYKYIPVAFALCLSMLCCGCSDGGSDSYTSESYDYSYDESYDDSYDNSYDVDADTADKASSENGETEGSIDTDKIVYTADVHMETLEYDTAVETVEQQMEDVKGYVESSYETTDGENWYYDDYDPEETYRTMNMTICIPVDSFEDFMDNLEQDGEIVSKTVTSENITTQYHDVSAQIEALEKEEKKLLEMVDVATSIDDMITVEDRLATVEAELNSYKSQLATMDQAVAYSTVTLEIEEVHTYTEPEEIKITFGSRIKDACSGSISAFGSFLQALIIIFIYLLPFIIVAGIIFTIILVCVKLANKKKKSRDMAHPNTDSMNIEKK